jgi:AsmA protein
LPEHPSSTLTFNVDAKQFEKPVLSFNLDLDGIDLDRYLPPPAEAKAKEERAIAPGQKRERKPDYAPLRKLVMDGTVRIGRLKVHGAKVSDVILEIKAKNGIIRVDPFSMNLYDGALSGNVTLNAQKDMPTIKTSQRLGKVQAGPLLKDLGYADKLEGVVNFKADIWAKGTEPEEIKKTLNGSGEFAFTDGAIVGFDIAQMVRHVKAALGLAKREKARTEFSELKGNFTIKNGIINNPNTYLSSPLLRVMGKGKVNLPAETIDYRVEPKFVATLKGQADTQRKSGLVVPVVISGPFSDPKVRPRKHQNSSRILPREKKRKRLFRKRSQNSWKISSSQKRKGEGATHVVSSFIQSERVVVCVEKEGGVQSTTKAHSSESSNPLPWLLCLPAA